MKEYMNGTFKKIHVKKIKNTSFKEYYYFITNLNKVRLVIF